MLKAILLERRILPGPGAKDKWRYKTKHGQAAELIAFTVRSITWNVLGERGITPHPCECSSVSF